MSYYEFQDNNENPALFPIGLEEKVINAVLAERTSEWRIFRLDFRWAGDDLFCFAYLTDGKQIIYDACYCGHPGIFDDFLLPMVTRLNLQKVPDPTFIKTALHVAEFIALNGATVIISQNSAGLHRYQRLQGLLTFVEDGSLAYYGEVQYKDEIKAISFTNNNALTPKTASYEVNIDGVDHTFQHGQKIVLLPSM